MVTSAMDRPWDSQQRRRPRPRVPRPACGWLLASGCFLFAATHLANHALGLCPSGWRPAGGQSSWPSGACRRSRPRWPRAARPRRARPVEAVAAAHLAHAAAGGGAARPGRSRSRSTSPAMSSARAGCTAAAAWTTATLLPGPRLAGGRGSQTILMLVVWLHGTIGLHVAAPAAGLSASGLALVVGDAPAGPGVGRLRQRRARGLLGLRALDPQAWAAAGGRAALAEATFREPGSAPRALDRARLLRPGRAVLVLRALRWLWLRRRNVRLTYPGRREVSVPRGLTILEASRLTGIPHAAVCGGRGRCSTCRVRVGQGARTAAPPRPRRSGASWRGSRPPRTCGWPARSRPTADLAVTPLMPATAATDDVLSSMDPSHGVEREIAVLFADLRGFTRLSEGRLPYDTVFILNRYFKAMGEAIEAAGGGRQVHRRRDHGAVRARASPERGVAGGARSGARHGLALDALNRRSRGRARRAFAHGHRRASGPGHPGRDGPRPGALADRDRRHGQRGEPARGADQGAGLPAHGRRVRRARYLAERAEVDLGGATGRLRRDPRCEDRSPAGRARAAMVGWCPPGSAGAARTSACVVEPGCRLPALGLTEPMGRGANSMRAPSRSVRAHHDAMHPPALAVEGIKKQFGQVEVLKGVSVRPPRAT